MSAEIIKNNNNEELAQPVSACMHWEKNPQNSQQRCVEINSFLSSWWFVYPGGRGTNLHFGMYVKSLVWKVWVKWPCGSN